MKRIHFLIFITISFFVLSITTAAASSDFQISGGIMTLYTGSDSVVTIPDEVTQISVGAFDNAVSVSQVTINSKNCKIDVGAIPSRIAISGYSNSTAEAAAINGGNTFIPLDPTFNLTINYEFSNGGVASSQYKAQIKSGVEYSVTSPQINGFTPDKKTVAGTMDNDDVTVTVYYVQNIESGWKIEGKNIKYYDVNAYLVSTSKSIDGTLRTFDGNGNLVLSDDFITISGKKYYLKDNQILTGYTVIGDGIYLFDSNGVMIAGKDYDGYYFDINGRLTGSDFMINIDGESYYIYNNSLYSGFCMIDNGLYYFGSDYLMLSDDTYDGYVFGSDGRMISGISVSELTIEQLSDLSYTGEYQTPPVKVWFNNFLLTENVHYTLEYADNRSPGTATVTISGIGPVSGSVDANFNILGEETFTLTVKYCNTVGMNVAKTYTTQVEPGAEFRVDSPDVEGYKPDQDQVNGVMGYSDITITVIYTKSVGTDTETADTETDKVTETSALETDATSDEKDDNVSVTYDYGLWITVAAIATLLAGGVVTVTINYDLIKKYIVKKKALFKAKRESAKQKKNGSDDNSK